MAERKHTVTLLGHPITVTEVPVIKSVENYSEYTLEDGSVIRVKVPVTMVLRIDGQYDLEGNPLYFVRNGNVVTVVSAPDSLRQRS